MPTQHQGESIQLLLLCKHNIEQNAHRQLADRGQTLFSLQSPRCARTVVPDSLLPEPLVQHHPPHTPPSSHC